MLFLKKIVIIFFFIFNQNPLISNTKSNTAPIKWRIGGWPQDGKGVKNNPEDGMLDIQNKYEVIVNNKYIKIIDPDLIKLKTECFYKIEGEWFSDEQYLEMLYLYCKDTISGLKTDFGLIRQCNNLQDVFDLAYNTRLSKIVKNNEYHYIFFADCTTSKLQKIIKNKNHQ